MRSRSFVLLSLVATARSAGWVDVVPDSYDCLRMIYRFHVDESSGMGGPRRGWCEPVAQDGSSLSGFESMDARPFYRDSVAADASWVGSNTTRWCGLAMAEISGWSRVECYESLVDGSRGSLALSTVLLSWTPVKHLLARNDMAAHPHMSGYVVVWDVVPAMGTTKVSMSVLPRVDSSTKLVGDCFFVKYWLPTRSAQASTEEVFCPVAGQSDYPHFSPSHAARDAKSGLALYFMHHREDSPKEDAEMEYKTELDEDMAKRVRISSRVQKVRRLWNRMSGKWL